MLASARAEIEQAVDEVQHTRSQAWFRRRFHLWFVEGASKRPQHSMNQPALATPDAYAMIRHPLKAKSVPEPGERFAAESMANG